MVLVEYSESDDSDVDSKSTHQSTAKEIANPQNSSFQKVVDRSNPSKIRVNLPKASKTATDDGDDNPEPPSKRVRLGSNAFSGFNSLLPAPKKTTVSSGGTATSFAKKGGLASGVGLKTGATPGFNREEVPLFHDRDEDGNMEKERIAQNSAEADESAISQDIIARAATSADTLDEKPTNSRNPMMFKPLSVMRKRTKKKSPIPGVQHDNSAQDPAFVQQSKGVPKVSLFATDKIQDLQSQSSSTPGEYQPMIFLTSHLKPDPLQPDFQEALGSESLDISQEALPQIHHTTVDKSSQSLDSIANDLNLSAPAKRQLLGRQRGNSSTINVVNFNTDQEYAANEILRQAGEQVQHNPVRSIAPGKHSLKQLVNAVSNQKDALEEQFASGRRNKKEAGSKYGW